LCELFPLGRRTLAPKAQVKLGGLVCGGADFDEETMVSGAEIGLKSVGFGLKRMNIPPTGLVSYSSEIQIESRVLDRLESANASRSQLQFFDNLSARNFR
jgi:hypothetical protein